MSKSETLKNNAPAGARSTERRSGLKPAAGVSPQPAAGAEQGQQQEEDDAAGEELVRVNVPKGFNYLGPDMIMHKFAAGEQNMRRKYAEASYAKAHGVTIIGDAE